MIDDHVAIDLAERVAAGQFDASTRRWLQKGVAAWILGGCAFALERSLHLPISAGKMHRTRRNVWLRVAAKQFPLLKDWVLATELSDQLDQFLSRGPWLAWRNLTTPPEDASELRTALFWAAKENDGESLSPKQMRRVLRHIST